jgi:hypothetical protein
VAGPVSGPTAIAAAAQHANQLPLSVKMMRCAGATVAFSLLNQ